MEDGGYARSVHPEAPGLGPGITDGATNSSTPAIATEPVGRQRRATGPLIPGPRSGAARLQAMGESGGALPTLAT